MPLPATRQFAVWGRNQTSKVRISLSPLGLGALTHARTGLDGRIRQKPFFVHNRLMVQGQGFLCELRAVRLPGKTECLECIDKTLKQLRLHLPQQSSRSWGQQDFHLRSAIMQTGKTRKTGRRRNLETSEGESLNLESSDLALCRPASNNCMLGSLSRTARRVRNEQMLRRQLLQGLSRHGPQRKIENGTNFEVSQVHSGGCIAATQLPAALRGAG